MKCPRRRERPRGHASEPETGARPTRRGGQVGRGLWGHRAAPGEGVRCGPQRVGGGQAAVGEAGVGRRAGCMGGRGLPEGGLLSPPSLGFLLLGRQPQGGALRGPLPLRRGPFGPLRRAPRRQACERVAPHGRRPRALRPPRLPRCPARTSRSAGPRSLSAGRRQTPAPSSTRPSPSSRPRWRRRCWRSTPSPPPPRATATPSPPWRRSRPAPEPQSVACQ